MNKCFAAVAVYALAFASTAQAHEVHVVKEVRNKNLVFTIAYLDPWGHTVSDASGLHYYHDKLSQLWGITPPLVSNDPGTILPSRYWGTYPLYYTGDTMDYVLTLRNEGHRKYRNIDIRTFQEYLNPDGSFGKVQIGNDAVRDFRVAELEGEKTVTFNGSIAIPLTGTSGLDQTDVVVFKERKSIVKHPGDDNDEDDLDEVAAHHDHHHDINGKIIFWEPQVGIWCPPASKPNKP